MAQVFGPDLFTVGADTNIDAYPAGDPDYAYITGRGSGSNLTANAANDRVQTPTTNTNVSARIIDAALNDTTQPKAVREFCRTLVEQWWPAVIKKAEAEAKS